jgi:hypothetical protein
MARLDMALSRELIDSILPVCGSAREERMIWDDTQRMFIYGDHLSATGHRYYKGVRMSNRLVIIQYMGKYFNWTYLDRIEVYAYDGRKLNIIQEKKYDRTFLDDKLVFNEEVALVRSFLAGVFKSERIAVSNDELSRKAEQLVGECYKSFLDTDYDQQLLRVVKQTLINQ